eukprot:SAG11_NODE_9006_length_954_cov_1.203509_1_plen_255_part_10
MRCAEHFSIGLPRPPSAVSPVPHDLYFVSYCSAPRELQTFARAQGRFGGLQNHDGGIEREEFNELLTRHLVDDYAELSQLQFRARIYNPVSFMALDLIPWGFQRTDFRLQEIVFRSTQGLCGMPSCSLDSNLVIAAEHALFLHLRAGPINFASFSIYATESVLLYSVCVAARIIISQEIGDYSSLFITCGWFAFRVGVMLRRRRAAGYIRALGQPAPSLLVPAKTLFALPIDQVQDCIKAFLFSRGAENTSEEFH